MEKGYKFLLMSRFSQDALENLFSTVRFKNPVPTAIEFKNALRSITISQCMTGKATSSYETDDTTDKISFLDMKLPPNLPDDLLYSEEQLSNDFDMTQIEMSSLEHLGGYIVHQFIKLNRHCEACVNALKIETPILSGEHDYQAKTQSLVQFKDYTKTALIYISPAVKDLLQCAEQLFKKIEDQIFSKQNLVSSLVENCKQVHGQTTIPDCHNAITKLPKNFFTIFV